jgi:hypothetical protein
LPLLAGCAVGPDPLSPGGYIAVSAQDLTGRWGETRIAAGTDRATALPAARAACRKPVDIARVGVDRLRMPDIDGTPREVAIKAGAGGRLYLGPPGPAGDLADSEIEGFDGDTLLLAPVDGIEMARGGRRLLARCGARRTTT